MITIPGYRIVRTLGKGGMATVYLAIQESFEREVALKVMSPNLSEDPKFSERFLREAKIVSRLMHPNIVTVYDVGLENGHHYLSMEYIPGKDLKSKRRFMTGKQCIRVIKEVAAALDYACKKGYVHRDVKPENIMLHEEDGRAILMDFGIACMEDTASGMTQTGTAIGTPHYMSPEQAKGRQVDSRSDIYSLGVVFFLCLTGHVPFDADSAVAVGIKHVSEAVPRLPKYLLLLQPIIDKVLAKDPKDRYQTGLELITAINQIGDDDLEAIDILATKKTIARIDTKDTEAPTVVSGNVKTIPSVQGGTQTAIATGTTAALKTQQVSAERRAVTSSAGNVATRSGPRKKVNVVEARATETKRHITASTSPITATTGPARATKTGTQSLAATEVLAVDEDDRRDHQRENPFGGGSRRIWPWLLLAGIVGIVAGSYYFKESLPTPMRDVVVQISQPVEQFIANLIGAPVTTSTSDNSTANAANTSDQTSTIADNSPPNSAGVNSDTTSINNPVGSATTNGTNPSSVSTNVNSGSLSDAALGDVALGDAKSLSDQLEQDISVAPQLAQMYRTVLATNPDNKNAELGLANLKQFHFSHIRDALRIRDIEASQTYFDSLQASFSDIATDDAYQRLEQRQQSAVKAQALIDAGNQQLAGDKLTSPPGANALESFNAALAVDAGNPLADEGIKRIVERYVTLARQALDAGNLQQSAQYLQSGLRINTNDEALKKIQQEVVQRQELETKIADILLKANRAVADGRLVSPLGDNAYEYYQQLRPLGRQRDADNGIGNIENQVAANIERSINSNDFDSAKLLLLQAKEKFTTSQKLLGLEVGLEQAIHADFDARQPKILKVLVSNRPAESINVQQKNPLSLDRTAYIGFEFKNFSGSTSVVQAVLYDGSRSVEIAQQPVIVMGEEDVKFFQIDRPVEGFAKGSYNIELLLDGKVLATMVFQVDNSALATQ